IYNYRELAQQLEEQGTPCRTRSDTEVILNLYRIHGTDCLRYLRGMFAFAIWDHQKRQLFAARDRIGIKPFYYLHSQKAFVFGSEIKAIAVSGHSQLRMNMDGIAGYLRFLVVPQPDSIFDDVRKLEPGHYLVVTGDGTVRDHVYWAPPVPSLRYDPVNEEERIAALDDLLCSSVRYHMVADVPVGAFLSGGLDSSTIVSLMRAQAPDQRIDAFSITFPGHAEYDEDAYAREVSRLKDVTYHADTINERFVDDLELMAWHLDEPFAINSAYATYYLARNAARHTKVVLTGDGGDELFAGYTGYQNNAYQHNGLLAYFSEAGYRLCYLLGKYTGARSSLLKRALTGLRRRSGSEGLRYSEQVAQSSLRAAGLVLNPDALLRSLKAWEHNLVAHYYDELADADRLQKKLYAEFRTRLVDEMLMKVDRMTMAHSLEARVPLLDHEVVEWAFQQPSEMKLRMTEQGPVSKYVLKRMMERHLPAKIIYRRKQGFDIPVGDWLDAGLVDLIREKVMGGNLRRLGLVDVSGLERLIRWHTDGHHHFTSMLMLLLAFESWIDAYQSRVGQIMVA
ncbi:MAG: asparagine synthase (glutamine-hydrolyzing), partial [Thermoplasmataceae archaeon]